MRGSSFVQFESDTWCQVWLKLVQLFWENDENVESLQTDDRWTDGQTNEQDAIRSSRAFSSGKQKINHNVQYISVCWLFYFLHNRFGEPWQPRVTGNSTRHCKAQQLVMVESWKTFTDGAWFSQSLPSAYCTTCGGSRIGVQTSDGGIRLTSVDPAFTIPNYSLRECIPKPSVLDTNRSNLAAKPYLMMIIQ